MIELEIQALSERRQGLLVEVGHIVIANGFTLQRQRLIQDPHGILLTLVVRGPARKKRALQEALDTYERFMSFQLATFVEGAQKTHFAASRSLSTYVPAAIQAPQPAAEVALAAPSGITATTAMSSVAFDEIAPARLTAAPAPANNSAVVSTATSAVAPGTEPAQDFSFIQPEPQRTAATTVPLVEASFVELIPLEPDQDAVAEVLSKLDTEYPQIMPRLQALARSVAEAAREPSLRLAGQRIGSWVSGRAPAHAGKLGLSDAIQQIGVPALQALVELEQEGDQLRIRSSPLCNEHGQSGCTFFSGFLEGVLAPVLLASEVTIFPVCCCSYGADDCVLALSD
ncbi:MAG: hypothetical protein ABI128_09250 [Rhodanobacter sp.]